MMTVDPDSSGPTRAPFRASLALALIAGGASAMLAIVGGALVLMKTTWPYAFGFDLNGDFPYPFPHGPEPVIIGVAVVALGTSILAALFAMARGHRGARAVAALLLLVELVAILAIVVVVGDGRRCGRSAYTGIEYCTSRGTAIARDVALLAIVPMVALVSVWWTRRRSG